MFGSESCASQEQEDGRSVRNKEGMSKEQVALKPSSTPTTSPSTAQSACCHRSASHKVLTLHTPQPSQRLEGCSRNGREL